jgi:hypothetical protein
MIVPPNNRGAGWYQLNSGMRLRFFDEQGSILIPILIFAVILNIVAGILAINIRTELNAQTRSRLVIDASNLGLTIQMMLSTPGACHANLVSNGFGTSLSEVNSRSAAGQIQILDASSQSFLSANQNYNHLSVQGLAFSPTPKLLSAAEPSYLSNLTIAVMAGDLNGMQIPVVVPFYFFTDPRNGQFSCFATSYPQALPAKALTGLLTLEDKTCANYMDSLGNGLNFMYLPGGRICTSNAAGLAGGP